MQIKDGVKMTEKIVVLVLGNRNSGKSHTWNELFGSTVRTGTNIRRLYLTKCEYVEVFLVSGSPEERETYVGEIITASDPKIVLCSMQYGNDVTNTIDYFLSSSFSIYCQWLNPGYNDEKNYEDEKGIIKYLLEKEAIISIRNGQANPTQRVRELRDFIYGWAKTRNLVTTEYD